MIEPIQIEYNQHFVTETTTSAGTTEGLEYIYISCLKYIQTSLYTIFFWMCQSVQSIVTLARGRMSFMTMVLVYHPLSTYNVHVPVEGE